MPPTMPPRPVQSKTSARSNNKGSHHSSSGAPEFGAMSVKELKSFINDCGLACDDCVEKADLVARAQQGYGSGGAYVAGVGLLLPGSIERAPNGLAALACSRNTLTEVPLRRWDIPTASREKEGSHRATPSGDAGPRWQHCASSRRRRVGAAAGRICHDGFGRWRCD